MKYSLYLCSRITNNNQFMKNKSIIACAIVGMLLLASCGLPNTCKSYSPYELDWNGYNSVGTFKTYFNGYEQTIYDHIGDTVKVYGCLYFKNYGYSESRAYRSPAPSNPFDLFDDEGDGCALYIRNEDEIEIPQSFYFKRLYLKGTVVFDDDLGCGKGTGLQLISIDTIP